MIGRVVCFQDPKLAQGRPDLAIQRQDGTRLDDERRARLGQPVRPSRLGLLRRRSRRPPPPPASTRSCSTTSASPRTVTSRGPSTPGRRASRGAASSPTSSPTRSSGSSRRASGSRPRSSGSRPRAISVSARCHAGSRSTPTPSRPMAYPVLYGGGELGIASPAAQPGETVFRTLVDFRRQVKGSRAQLVPWVQDWNYAPDQVLAQIAAARLQGAKGYLLWNASGHLHEGGARPPRARSSRASGRYGASRDRGSSARLRARSAPGRGGGSAGPARTRSPSPRAGSRPRTAAAAPRRRRQSARRPRRRRRSSSSRLASGSDCGEAQALIRLSRGRVRK